MVDSPSLDSKASGFHKQVSSLIPRNRFLRYGERLKLGRLENGLEYRVMAHPYPVGIVHAHLVVNSGSLHEEEDERGLAHFLEHCVFLGTERYRSADEMRAVFSSLGMSWGGDVNAFTSFDETVFTLSCPAKHHSSDSAKRMCDGVQENQTDSPESPSDGSEGRKRKRVAGENCATTEPDDSERPRYPNGSRPEWDSNVYAVLDLLHQLGRKALLEAGDAFQYEKKAVLSEEQLRGTINYRVDKTFSEQIYEGTLLPRRMPIGDMEIIKSCVPEQLISYYRKWYRLNNMCIVVCGDIEPESVIQMINEIFSSDVDLPVVTERLLNTGFLEANELPAEQVVALSRSMGINTGSEIVDVLEDILINNPVKRATDIVTAGVPFDPALFLRWATRQSRFALPDLSGRYYRAAPTREKIFQHDLLRTVSITIIAIQPPVPTFDERETFLSLVDSVISHILHSRFADAVKQSSMPPFLTASWEFILSPSENCCTNALTLSARCSKWRDGLTAVVSEVARLVRDGCSPAEFEWASNTVMKEFRDSAKADSSEDSREYTSMIAGDWISGTVTTGQVHEYAHFASYQSLLSRELINQRVSEVFSFVTKYFDECPENPCESWSQASLFAAAPIRLVDDVGAVEIVQPATSLHKGALTTAAPTLEESEDEVDDDDLDSLEEDDKEVEEAFLASAENAATIGFLLTIPDKRTRREMISSLTSQIATGTGATQREIKRITNMLLKATCSNKAGPSKQAESDGDLTINIRNENEGDESYISIEEILVTFEAALSMRESKTALSLPETVIDESKITAEIAANPPKWLPPVLTKSTEVRNTYGGEIPHMDVYDQLEDCMLEIKNVQSFGGLEDMAAALGNNAFKRDPITGITMASLDNGMRVCYKQSNLEPNRCTISLWFRGGRIVEDALNYPPQQLDIAVASVFDGGVAGVPAIALSRLTTLWGAYFEGAVLAEGLSIRVEFNAHEENGRGSFEDILSLLVAYWKFATWESDCFERQRERRLIALTAAEKSLAYQTSLALSGSLVKDRRRIFSPATPEEVRNYSLDVVQRLFRAQCQPELAELLVCGDFDESRVRQAIWRYCGTIKGDPDAQEIIHALANRPLASLEPKLFDKTKILTIFVEDQVRTSSGTAATTGSHVPMAATLEVVWPSFSRYGLPHPSELPASAFVDGHIRENSRYHDISYRARAWKFLEEIIGDRLTVEVREKRGLSYDVSISVNCFDQFSFGTVNFSATPDPKEVSRIWDAIMRVTWEISHEKPPTDKEFERARGSLLSEVKSGLKTNNHWLLLMASLQAETHPKTLYQIQSVYDFYESITIEDVRALANSEWFKPEPALIALSISGPVTLQEELTKAKNDIESTLAARRNAEAGMPWLETIGVESS